MSRWAVLLLPLLLILAVDPVALDYHAVKYVAALGGAAICIGAALARGRFSWTNLGWALAIFVAVRGFMVLRSPMPGEAVHGWALLLALCLVHLVHVERSWLEERAPRVFGVLLAALSLYALGQYVTGEKQAHASFANKNFLAAGLAMLLPFALALDRRIALLGLFGLFATQSRGGALAGAAALGLWFFWEHRRFRVGLLFLLPVVVLAAGLAFGEQNTVKVRLAWYKAAFEMGLESPLAGKGAGGFQREYPPVRPIEEHRISGGDRVHAVHNDYLESFAEGGLLGLAAHVLLLAVVLRAVRRHRVAACSLLAFAVASLVDLPLRDPSLLALAFLPLAMVAERRPLPGWVGAPALVSVLAFVPFAWGYWRADRIVGRYLETRDRSLLDEALAWAPRHPAALLERRGEADLDKLIEMEPHHAGALYNRTEGLFDDEAIAALEDILLHHDKHHSLTRAQLGLLLRDRDPVAAASVLDDAIDADPRPYRPYVVLANIHRSAGRLDQAERFLREAEARSGTLDVRRERMELELEKPNGNVAEAARRLPSAEIRHRIAIEFAKISRIFNEDGRPKLPREEGESDADFAARVQKAQERWVSIMQQKYRPHYNLAAELAGALVVKEPTAQHFRLLAEAERGRRNRKTADHAAGFALFLETLDELRKGRREFASAKGRFIRALRTYPGLLDDVSVPQAIRLFLQANPGARDLAHELFRNHPPFAKAVDDR